MAFRFSRHFRSDELDVALAASHRVSVERLWR